MKGQNRWTLRFVDNAVERAFQEHWIETQQERSSSVLIVALFLLHLPVLSDCLGYDGDQKRLGMYELTRSLFVQISGAGIGSNVGESFCRYALSCPA